MMRIIAASVCCLYLGGALIAQQNAPNAVQQAPVTHGARLFVKGMGCPLCATNVKKKLERVQYVQSVLVDLNSGVVKVTAVPNQTLAENLLRKAVVDAGFELTKIERF